MSLQSRKTFKANSQQQITGLVEDLVAEYGFSNIIHSLLMTVRHYCTLSVACPGNREFEREYKRWSKAVRAVCDRRPKMFGEVITLTDEIRARALASS
jgi:hypothetical protein